MVRSQLLALCLVLLSCLPPRLSAQPEFRWGTEFDLNLGFVRLNPLNWTMTQDIGVVIAAASGNRIALFNLAGDTLSGWPTTETEDWWVQSGPRLGDVTGNGDISVVVMMRSYWADNVQLRVYDINGTIREEFTRTWMGFPNSSLGNVILEDIDENGIDNIVFAVDSIYAFNSHAEQIPSFPRALRGLSIGEKGLVVIPENLYPGKALLSVSNDSINIELITDPVSLNGWPRHIPYDAGLQTQPIVIPYDNSFAVALFSDDSLHVWDNQGSSLPGFPIMLGVPSEQCRDISATDIELDGIPEISLQLASGRVWIVDLEGNILPGFPWNADRTFKGFAEDVLSYHIQSHDSSCLVFPVELRDGIGTQYLHGIMQLEGRTESTGFPAFNDRIEATYFPSAALIWTNRSDTLHIIHLAPYGYLSRFDLPLPGASVKLIWPRAGCHPGGNRVYNPGPYVGVNEQPVPRAALPHSSVIRGVYPNPSNAGVRVDIDLLPALTETLRITNVLGQTVWSLSVSGREAGEYVWPGIDQTGAPVASGRYFVMLAGQPGKPVPFTILR